MITRVISSSIFFVEDLSLFSTSTVLSTERYGDKGTVIDSPWFVRSSTLCSRVRIRAVPASEVGLSNVFSNGLVPCSYVPI